MNRTNPIAELLTAGALLLAIAAFLMVGGCDTTGRPVFMRNPDPALRKEATQFAADAALRHPYKADAPKGDAKEAPARCQVEYAPLSRIEIVNLSETKDYENVEIWVNKNFVVFLPKMEKKVLKHLDFKMIYDKAGNPFEVTPEQKRIETVQMLLGGKMYDVPVQLAD